MKPAMYSVILPEALLKFVRRLMHLKAGQRYMIVLTLPGGDEEADWTIQPLGKVEK